VLDKINAEALAVFKNLTTSAVFDGKTYDRFTQPYELDKLKILHDNARRFQRNYGLINLKELVLGELRHSRDELYLLDYRKHLLSPGEFLTADILASKDFVLRDLNMEEASLNAPRRQLHSMGGVIDFPMTERGAATFARALELGLGAVDEVENDDFFQYRGTVSSPELQVTGDRQAAAKAFLIARFGTTEFLQLSWLGEFSDDEGTYHAYLKAGHSPDVLRGTLQGQFFSNPEQMMEDWETLKKDMRATPATIRYHRQYAELRRKIDHFTLTTGLEAKAAGADLNLGFVRESVTQDLRLDGERVLPHLSARQSENILIAAKFFKPKSTAS
jgi:hypothetical protein